MTRVFSALIVSFPVKIGNAGYLEASAQKRHKVDACALATFHMINERVVSLMFALGLLNNSDKFVLKFARNIFSKMFGMCITHH